MEVERNRVSMVSISDFKGMASDVDPRDLDRATMQLLENAACEVNGKLISRRGYTYLQAANATGLANTKRSAVVFKHPIYNWLVADEANGKFRVLDISGDGTTNYLPSIYPSWHAEPRMSFAQTKNNELVVVNGINRPWKFNGNGGTTVNGEGPFVPLGIDPPTAGPSVTTPASGNARAGTYYTAYRYLDRDGNPSVLSAITEVTAATGDKFEYTSVANAAGISAGRVTQKQIFRSLVDDPSVLYLVTTIADNTTTTYTSDTLSDVDLSENTALPILNSDESLNANRHVVPPNQKRIACWHQSRLWFWGDGRYSTGTVSGTSASTTVTGSGTAFTTPDMVGWELYVAGTAHSRPYIVQSVGSTTSLTVTPALQADISAGTSYVLRPPRIARNLLYFSELDEPESVPQSQNFIPIEVNRADEDDEGTGLFSMSGTLYVAKERILYAVESVRQPHLDGSVAQVADRGMLNERCAAVVGGTAFCLDRYGPYVFSGGQVQQVGEGVANYFRDGLIDFTKTEYFHVAVNRRTRAAYFFCCLVGDSGNNPRMAFVYNFAKDRMWIEKYPWGIEGAGTVQRSGTDVFFLLPGGYAPVYDLGYASDGTTSPARGTVTSYNSVSGALQATSSVFVSGHLGASITFLSGSSKNVASVIGTYTDGDEIVIGTGLSIAAGDTFAVGGIPWRAKTAMTDIRDNGGNRDAIIGSVWYKPTANSGNLLDVRHYLNHRTSPENAYADMAEEGEKCGHTSGSPDSQKNMHAAISVLADQSGVGRKRLSMSPTLEVGADRHLTLEIRSVSAEERHHITQIDIEGVR